MKKRTFYLSDAQIAGLAKAAKNAGTGITVADIVRRAIDEYLRRPRQRAGLAVV